MLKFDMLPQSKNREGGEGFPMLFYGCLGEDMAEIDSPSYYNPVECNCVVEVVERMLKSEDIDIGTGEIGVIAAFRSQVIQSPEMSRCLP